MRSVKKKIMVYSVLGLMQMGLLTGVASASPLCTAGTSGQSSFLAYLMQCYEDIFCQNQSSDLQTDCDQILSEKGSDTNNCYQQSDTNNFYQQRYANNFYQQFQKQCNK